MDHLSAAGSSATRNLTTTEPPKSLNRRKTVNFRFQRPHATSRSFFFNKPMRAMDSRRDFTSKKVFPGHFSELGEKANSALTQLGCATATNRRDDSNRNRQELPRRASPISCGRSSKSLVSPTRLSPHTKGHADVVDKNQRYKIYTTKMQSHLKLVFGSGNSDPAKIRPLKI